MNPRKNNEFTSRGFNILFMSRRGNLILGDYSLLEQNWYNELLDIIKLQGCYNEH